MHISKLPIIIILLLLVTPAAWCQYDRAVVAMTKMDYVYYNIDNPMSVSVPGLLPNDIVVSIAEDRAFLHRDPDGSNVNDFIVRPKDSVGTIVVHVDERLSPTKTRNRGIMTFRILTIPNPTIYLGYVRQGDTMALSDLLHKSYIQVKAQIENFNFILDEPEVLSYEINRSESFQQPVTVEGNKITPAVRNMLDGARRDETIYLENIKILQPDGRILTLSTQFPLK